MAKTSNVRLLEAVARGIGESRLKSRGFRRTGSTFRREVEPGFVQIIDFGLGQSWSMYSGQFTVDVCIFVAEVYEVLFSDEAPRTPKTEHCELRQRLGMLDNPPQDRWWPVSLPMESLVAEVGGAIEDLALPFLALLENRRALVEQWREKGTEALGLKPRAELMIATVLIHMGDREAAEDVLRSAISDATGEPWEEFYTEVARKLGIDV
jgi:hypothetical protein